MSPQKLLSKPSALFYTHNPAMRSPALLLLLLFAIEVIATGGSGEPSGAQGPVSSAPVNGDPYDGEYAIDMRPSSLRAPFSARLENHIGDVWQVPNVHVEPVELQSFSPTDLRANFNYDRNLRRHLYLYNTYSNFPDMVFATPMHREPRPQGNHLWALFSAHQPPFQGDHPLIRVHGFVTVSNGGAVVQRLSELPGPQNRAAVEKGHVLNIQELFQQLGRLRWPHWDRNW